MMWSGNMDKLHLWLLRTLCYGSPRLQRTENVIASWRSVFSSGVVISTTAADAVHCLW